MSVIEHNQGELLIARRACIKRTFDHTMYGPCPDCLQWLKIDTYLSLHQKTCIAKKEEPDKKKVIALQSDIVAGKIEMKGSERLRTRVLPHMKHDDVSTVAKNDPLIIR